MAKNEGWYLENSLYTFIPYTKATIQQRLFCCLQQRISEKQSFTAGPEDIADPVLESTTALMEQLFFLRTIDKLQCFSINNLLSIL